jgi:hypothetical protein
MFRGSRCDPFQGAVHILPRRRFGFSAFSFWFWISPRPAFTDRIVRWHRLHRRQCRRRHWNPHTHQRSNELLNPPPPCQTVQRARSSSSFVGGVSLGSIESGYAMMDWNCCEATPAHFEPIAMYLSVSLLPGTRESMTHRPGSRVSWFTWSTI